MLANSANRLRMTVDYNFPKGGVTLPASNVNSVTTIEEFHWRAWIFIPLAGILAGIFLIFWPSADHLTGLIVSRFGFFNTYLVHCPGLSNYITMNNCVVPFVF